jgi:hypothetical protein
MQTHVHLLSLVRPRAEDEVAPLRVKGEFSEVDITEAAQVGVRHPYHLTCPGDEGQIVGVFDIIASTA